MLISKAYAQAQDAVDSSMTSLAAEGGEVMAQAPDATEAFIWNMGLVVVLVVLFYLLLIRPQQKRFKEHSAMLAALEKGDKVVTGGGLIGKIDKLVDEEHVVIDLGSGVKVNVLRSAIQSKNDNSAILKKDAANDSSDEKKTEKKPAAKKSTASKSSNSAKKSNAKKTAKK